MSTLNIAVIQSELSWHDAPANRDRFAERISSLDASCDLIVLPEMFTTGFSMDAPGQAESMDGPSMQWLADTSAKAGAAICGSLIISDTGHYYNRYILMRPDGSFEHYDKRHLFRLAGEGEHYSAGFAFPVISLNDWRIRPMVCYDLRFPLWSRRHKDADYDLLIYVANWPSARHHAWETLLRARAIENQCYLAGVNRVGVDGNDLPYSGGSAIVDYLGHDIVNLGANSDTALAALDKAALVRFRDRFPFDLDADSFTLHTGE